MTPITAVEYYKWCDEAAEIDFSMMQIDLRGENATVEVDEAKFGTP